MDIESIISCLVEGTLTEEEATNKLLSYEAPSTITVSKTKKSKKYTGNRDTKTTHDGQDEHIRTQKSVGSVSGKIGIN